MDYQRIAKALVENSSKLDAAETELREARARRDALLAVVQSGKEEIAKSVGNNIRLRVWSIDGTAVVVDKRVRDEPAVAIIDFEQE
jgi:hypothetical protein